MRTWSFRGNSGELSCHAAWYKTRHNLAERGLKMAILHRKNSLAFMTLRGARVGDVFMSLIHTCELNRVNPFNYLMALQQHTTRVARTPTQWLPWNYSDALDSVDTG